MAYPTIAFPQLLTDPGYLFYAPVGTSLPANTVVGSVFTDLWSTAGAWVPLGMTDAGTTFTPTTTISPIEAAESFDPLVYRTTARTSQIEFMLKSYTATNISRAYNGATLTVTGSTTTTLTQIDPPVPGTETRCMIGFESYDSTYRLVCFQAFNSGAMKKDFKKAPSNTAIPWVAMLEKPTSTQPWREWTTGTARA